MPFWALFLAVHQFCKIGGHSFLGRATKVVQDILPYVVVTGNPGAPHSLNVKELKRRGFAVETISQLKRILHMFIKEQLPIDEIRAALCEMKIKVPAVNLILASIESSDRGLAR